MAAEVDKGSKLSVLLRPPLPPATWSLTDLRFAWIRVQEMHPWSHGSRRDGSLYINNWHWKNLFHVKEKLKQACKLGMRGPVSVWKRRHSSRLLQSEPHILGMDPKNHSGLPSGKQLFWSSIVSTCTPLLWNTFLKKELLNLWCLGQITICDDSFWEFTVVEKLNGRG